MTDVSTTWLWRWLPLRLSKVSHQQQFFSELPSPRRSHNTNYRKVHDWTFSTISRFFDESLQIRERSVVARLRFATLFEMKCLPGSTLTPSIHPLDKIAAGQVWKPTFWWVHNSRFCFMKISFCLHKVDIMWHLGVDTSCSSIKSASFWRHLRTTQDRLGRVLSSSAYFGNHRT